MEALCLFFYGEVIMTVIKGKIYNRKGFPSRRNYNPAVIQRVREKLTPMPNSPYPHIPNPGGWWPLAKKTTKNPYA